MKISDRNLDLADRIEDNLEDAFEGGMPKLGRSLRRGAVKLARKAALKGSQAEEIVEPGRIARRIIIEAVSHAYAIDTRGDELIAPDYYYVTVPWVSYRHLYEPHLDEITRNIEGDVTAKLGSDRYLIRIDPHIAIVEGDQLPDDKFDVRVCYSKGEWDALCGERENDVPVTPDVQGESGGNSNDTADGSPDDKCTVLLEDVSSGSKDDQQHDGGPFSRHVVAGDAKPAYIRFQGREGRIALRDGMTIGRSYSEPGHVQPDIDVSAFVDDPGVAYVSHISGAFKWQGDSWTYEQLGTNATTVVTLGGERRESRTGDDGVRLANGDRLYISGLSVPVVYNDLLGDEPPTEYRPSPRPR